jgi:hypothetical protein
MISDEFDNSLANPESPLFVASNLVGLSPVGWLFDWALAKVSQSFRLTLNLCWNIEN